MIIQQWEERNEQFRKFTKKKGDAIGSPLDTIYFVSQLYLFQIT